MPNPENLERVANLLEEIRDNQKRQLERQAEALALQKEQFQLVLKQYEKAATLQDRAESVQARLVGFAEKSRRFVKFAMIAVVALLLYAGWLIVRSGGY